MKLYASLVGPLVDLYYPLPFEDEIKCRVALNSSRLKHLWCSVYSEGETDEFIAEFGGMKLPDYMADKLDYDSHEIAQFERRNSNDT